MPEPRHLGQRPDPDALLHRINEEENRERKGKLKIFFGMCAGVGKTYEMLKTAQQLRSQGVDVVIGLVETHRRAETEALIVGMEIVPRKSISYKTTVLQEMDLDAILARKPRIVLVDELAHTNAPGSRHLKRFQDVDELLNNGIDVYSTLNVQHLESRADTVAKVTGITVRETVPDSIFESADEVEIVDTSEEVLLQRFAEGKIYAPDRSREALRNFFRKGNISALREMALRLTAERVDQDLLDRDDLQGGTRRSGQRFIIGLKGDVNGEEMIRSAKRLSYASKAPWVAVHVELPDEDDAGTRERLAKQFKLAKELGAETITTSDTDIARGLLRVAERQNASQVVVGRSVGPRWSRRHRVLDRLLDLSPQVDIHVLTDRRGGERRWHLPVTMVHSRPSAYFVALALVALVAGASYPFADQFGYQTVALLLLMMISLLSLVLGIGPVLLASAVSALAWDYFFIPPRFTIAIAKTEDVLMFVAYFVFATVTGILTSRIRAQERAVRQREERSSALYALTRELSSARSQDDILRVAVHHLQRIFHCDAVVLTGEPDGDINPTPHPHSTFAIDEKELAVAAWAYWNEKSAGQGTDTLPNASATYFPIRGSRYPLAVFGLRMPNAAAMHPDQETLLENCFALISTALDREVLHELTRRTSVAEASDRLYQALFNSISHELKTPIASVLGNAENLLNERVTSSPEAFRRTVEEIQSAAERLHRVLGRLLDMSRIESTTVRLNVDWVDIRDAIQTTLRTLAKETSAHHVHVDVPDAIPLVKVDGPLIEQALVNLIDNAAAYTPAGSTIAVRAETYAGQLILTVADNGPGFPPDAMAHAFDKFYRVPGSRAGGTGLGLSIVKGLVEAHKGSVRLENRLGGGAQFTIMIPAEMQRIEAGDLRE